MANIIYDMKERRFRIITANVIICSVLAIALTTALLTLTPDTPAVVETNNAVYSGNRSGDCVSLMVNVYEGTEYVEQIATLLDEYGFKTTFFVGGKWVERNGDTVLKLAADGFELGNHGYLHRDHSTLNAAQNRDEIVLTEKLLKASLAGLGEDAAAAAVPKLFAPPSGSLGDAMFDVCEGLGYSVVMWTRDTVDWRDHDPDVIYERAVKNLQAGDLVLMHPTAATVQALPRILEEIKARGLRVGTVTQTLSSADENTGTEK